MTEQETRGRTKKTLEKDVLKQLIEDAEHIPTTQEIRVRYNNKVDDSAAHQTVKKNLESIENVDSLSFSDRTGWVIGE